MNCTDDECFHYQKQVSTIGRWACGELSWFLS